MTTDAVTKLIPWPSLSHYGIELIIATTPDGRKLLTVYGDIKKIDLFRDRLASELDFKSTKSGYMARADLRFSKADLERVFPLVKVNKMLQSQVLRSMTRKPAPEQNTSHLASTPINAAVIAAIPIGYNHLGQEVLEGENGRFIRQPDHAMLREAEAQSPAMFLRAPDTENLALCADGFVRSILDRGIVYRAADIKKFAATVLGETVDIYHPRLREIQESIEAGCVRALARKNSAPTEQAFHEALALYEAAPNLIYRTSASVDLQQYSTPLPMGILVQRLLGDVNNKTVLEPAIGNGSLVSLLAQGGAKIYGFDLDPMRAAAVKKLLPGAEIAVGDSLQMEMPRCDFVVANPPFGGLEIPVSIAGMRVSRIDHHMLMQALAARSDEGHAIFIIGADKTPRKEMAKVAGSSRYLFNWLADNYDVEAIATVDGALYSGQGAGYPVRIVVIGKRGKEFAHKQVPGEIPVIRTYEDLFNWTDAVLAARPMAAKRLPGSTPETEMGPRQRASAENQYQSPYKARSKLGESSTMLPRNLLGPMNAAFAGLEEKLSAIHGNEIDFDRYVAMKLGVKTEELGQYFSPEQADVLALGISKIEEDRALIIGDETGIGKGRTLAGFCRWALHNGVPIVFITEKANLFTDFYRDLADTGIDKKLKPLIVNDGVTIFDTHFKRLHTSSPRVLLNRFIKSGLSPIDEGYNITLATYSQFNRSAAQSEKSSWLSMICKDALVIVDESHNAAGESNVGANLTSALAEARGVVYSSATFAKKAANMGVYASAFPESVDTNSLPATLKHGGEPLLEVLSAALCEDGVFIRREHDLSELTVRTKLPSASRITRNEAFADKLSDILALMAFYAGDTEKVITARQSAIKREVEKLPEEVRKGSRMGVSSMNFGSRLYNITSQFLLALKTDDAIDAALEALEEGRKPVIMTETTQEALLKDFLAQQDDEDVQNDKPVSGLVEQNGIVLDSPITFRDVLRRTLTKLHTVIERDRYGNPTRRNVWEMVDDPGRISALQIGIGQIDMLINTFPDLPVSPLDCIREALEKKGYSCREISGRETGVITRADGKMVIVKRDDSKHRVRTNYDFNNGNLDAVIITTAGATGLSLHALAPTARNPSLDPRQREYIELKIPNNVATRKQGFGRVNRKGQVSYPIITTLGSGLPAEMRVMSMQNQKLRAMSANTTGSRENIAEVKDIPDILNSVGNEICRRYLESHPSMLDRLGIKQSELNGEDGASEDEAYFANRVTSRIGILHVHEQRQALDELTTEFTETVREMTQRGENPFKLQELDWRASITERTLLEGQEVNRYQSVFDKPVYLSTITYCKVVEPIPFEEIKRRATEGLARLLADDRAVVPVEATDSYWYGNLVIAPFIKLAELHGNALMEMSLAISGKFASIDEALKDTDNNPVKGIRSRLDFLGPTLSQLLPGAVVVVPDKFEGDKICVVTSIVPPLAGKEHYLGQWEIDMVPIGDNRPIQMTLNMFNNMESDSSRFKGNMLLNKNSEQAIKKLVASSGTKKKTISFSRHVLDGNLFRAAQMAVERQLGDVVVYTQADGSRHSAVLVRSTLNAAALRELPVKLYSSAVAAEFLRDKAHQHLLSTYSLGNNGDRDDAITLRRLHDGHMMLQVPGTRSKGGHVFLDAEIRDVAGEFSGNRAHMRATFHHTKLEKVLDILNRRLRISFFASYAYREQIDAISAGLRSNSDGENENPQARAA